jgi:hypothetical protein
VQYVEKLMKESWEAETSAVSRKVVDPLIIRLRTPRKKVIQMTGQSVTLA